MAYRVVIVEEEQEMLNNILAVLRKSSEFEIAATYKTPQAALGQAGMFQPNLFLISVDEDEILDTIPNFVEAFPGAYILGTIDEWDTSVVGTLLKSGATGCILKPFTAKEILEYLQLYTVRGQHKPVRLISFFSPKGRAGRTTLAAILALLIAEKTGERVAMIDADLQFGDLPIFFDIEPTRTVVDATQDIKLLTPVTFAPYFHKIKNGVYLLSSPDRPEYAELVEPETLVEVVRMAGNIFRYVLVDLPAGFNPLALNICRISDDVFVTTMINSGFEISHARKAMDMFLAQDDKRRRVHTVFTRVNPFNEDQRQKIAAELKYPVDVIIPNEYKMISIANSGRLAQGLPSDSLLMKTIDLMADKIIGEEARK